MKFFMCFFLSVLTFFYFFLVNKHVCVNKSKMDENPTVFDEDKSEKILYKKNLRVLSKLNNC